MSLKNVIFSALATLGRVFAILGFISWFLFLIAGFAIEELNSYKQIETPSTGLFKYFALKTDLVDTGIKTSNGKDLKYVTIDNKNILVVVNSKNNFFNAPRGGVMNVSFHRDKEYEALINSFGLNNIDNKLPNIEFEHILLVQSIKFGTFTWLCFGIGVLGLILIPFRYKGVVAERF